MDNKELHLYSEKEKYQLNQQWFKDSIDNIEKMSKLYNHGFTNDTEYRDMKINYDLYKGIIDKSDFMQYCSINGYNEEFPSNFMNENIISDKVKVVEGMEISRPFYFKVLAVNPEATSRKEQEYFKRYKKFVVETIMGEIQSLIQQEELSKIEGQKPTQEQLQQIQESIAQKVEANTPDEVKRYMERNYQDPAEVLASQLLEYMMYSLNIKQVFNKGWSDVLKVSREIYRIYIEDGEPKFDRVNPIKFDFDRNAEMIQDGEWAVAEYYYSIIDIVKEFPNLTDDELKNLTDEYLSNDNIRFFDNDDNNNTHIIAKHYTWKSLRKIGFLQYLDQQTGKVQEKIVDEYYKINPNYGDIEINWKRIVEVYEGWKIGQDTFTKMGRVDYIRDIDDINNVKLPYSGILYDSGTSLIDRMKGFQYLYDIVINKMRTLMASDKGKLLLMNIGIIPRSQDIDVKKWLEYSSKLNIGFYNPHEEGNRVVDVNGAAKVLDLSLTSDIQKYIEWAAHIENRCGESVGITKQTVGRIGPNEAVGNTQQSIIQSSFVLEPYFNLHNVVKRHTLEYLLNTARLAYSGKEKKKLSFALDDLSAQILNMDYDMLLFNTFGIFISNTTKPDELKQNITALAHAALQSQKVEFSDVIKIMKTDNPEEATEILRVAERNNHEKISKMQQQEIQANQQEKEAERKHDINMIQLKGRQEINEIRAKGDIDLQKQTILSMGFNENKDLDNDGTPDVLEIARHGLDADVKQRKIKLDEEKFKHQKLVDKEKIKIEKRKLNKDTNNK